MDIIKRDGRSQPYQPQKIKEAVRKAFLSVDGTAPEEVLSRVTRAVELKITALPGPVQVETIQDLVEQTLMEQGYYQQSKNYILYRSVHARRRELRRRIAAHFDDSVALDAALQKIQHDFPGEGYELGRLEERFVSFLKSDMPRAEKRDMLVKAAVELTTQQSPQWEFIAGRLLMLKFQAELTPVLAEYALKNFCDKCAF
jgi:ribonucleoside-diphosphate reductase alpha chain